MTSTSRVSLALVALSASSLFAQSQANPQFEVASIRPSAISDRSEVSVGVHIDGAQVRAIALSLKEYVGIAYRMKVSQISGPDWIGSERYDISAILPEGGKEAQIPEMFQALLVDRFQLKSHPEKKDFPVFALLPGKAPLKLKEEPASPDDDKDEPKGAVNVEGGGSRAGVALNLGHGASFTFANDSFSATKMTMPQVASNLERFAGRPIIDMSGLKGRYDFTITFTPEDYRAMLIRSAIAAGVSVPPQALRALEGASDSALGDALEQVGLKLEARKAPIDVLVVDSANKTPAAN
jgi:uncharacterized protein (TIGR03435 family)